MANQWTVRDIAREWTRNPRDRERQAAWTLLSLLDERITGAFAGDRAPRGLDRDRLLSVGWSETEELIARAGAALFHGSGALDFGRMAYRFNDNQMVRVKKALGIYRGNRKAPRWKTEPYSMGNSSAAAQMRSVTYPWFPDPVHAVETSLPCGTMVRTPLSSDTDATIEELTRTVAKWTACEHRICRTQFALAWARCVDAAPALYREMRAVGDGTDLLRLLHRGTDHEREVAERLERQSL